MVNTRVKVKNFVSTGETAVLFEDKLTVSRWKNSGNIRLFKRARSILLNNLEYVCNKNNST